MSIIVNHVRLSNDVLRRWREDPRLLARIYDGTLRDAQHIDLDKAWEAIAWLLSDIKREEKRREAAAFSDTTDLDPGDTEAWNAAMDAALEVDDRGLEPDLMLVAVEGRSIQREKRLDFGYGPACVIDQGTVRAIDAALKLTSLDDLRREYDPAKMDRQMVYPEIWTREGTVALEEYVLPYFNQLRELYRDAARSDQSVVVFFA